jgi:glycosyltransferase involved in cell wall biosynthesis
VKPDLSVIIPSFQRPLETIRATRSALNQRGLAVEIVVIDDASPTPLILPGDCQADERVRLLRLPDNQGAAAARNVGVEASRADAIAFLDSDDFFLPDTLAPRLTWFNERCRSAPLLCAAGVWRWSPGNATLAVPVGASDLAWLAAGCWYFPGSTGLLSRETWEAVGPLNPSLRRLEDLDWGIRLGLAGGSLAIAPIVATVVSRSGPANLGPVAQASQLLISQFGPEAPRPLPTPAMRRLRAYLALERAYAALGERRHAQTLIEWVRSFAHVPRVHRHQRSWWAQRPATRAELEQIEQLGRLPASRVNL